MTKHLASPARPLLSRPMKRLALSISVAVAALGFGACEQQPSADLPEHYLHKANHGAGAGHEAAPTHGEKEKTPAGEHKG